jgi:acetyl-CoA carboxylase carboxyltransferase component
MAEKALTKRDLEQTFKGFEKRQDEKMKTLEKRVIDQFHIISEGLIDQIKLLAEGHAGIIDRLNRMEKENERQHQETRSIVKLSFTELDRRLTDLETQMKEMREWKKQVEGRLQI